MKIFYFDLETTGLDPVKNGIWQIGGIIEVDGKVEDEFDLKVKPFDTDEINTSALRVGGVTESEISTYPSHEKVILELNLILNKHCNKYDQNDKYYPAGYNVGFDLSFLSAFYKKAGDNYLGSFLNWRAIDPLAIIRWLEFMGGPKFKNQRLETVSRVFGVNLDNAYDALADIRATRELIIKLKKNISFDVDFMEKEAE